MAKLTEMRERMKLWYYPASFVSFWIAISLQSQISKFLTGKIPLNIINISTIGIMWALVIWILPMVLLMVMGIVVNRR